MPNTTSQIQQQFVAYLGRPATSAELDQWIASTIHDGPDAALASLHAALAASAELGARFLGAEAGDMITQVYVGLFGTPPSRDELLQHLSPNLHFESDPAKVIEKALAQATQAEKIVMALKLQAAASFTSTVP